MIQLNLTGNDLNETGIKLTKRIDNQFNFFERTTSEDVVDLYINSIALSYGQHTTYMSPKRTEDFDIDMSLSLEGIGALLSTDGLYTTISSLVPGGPAEKSDKLKPNDRIVGVAQETEDEIMTHIESLRGRVTIILITHSQSALKNCNKIFNLVDGNLT